MTDISWKIAKPVPKDVETVKRIEIESDLSPWTQEDYALELERDDTLFFIIRNENEIAGFIVARLIMQKTLPLRQILSPGSEQEVVAGREIDDDSLIEILNLAVRKKFRNRSCGSRLLGEIIEEGWRLGISRIHLEVRKSNRTALQFYRRHHFEIVGERKNFYANPPENAILMCRALRSAKST